MNKTDLCKKITEDAWTWLKWVWEQLKPKEKCKECGKIKEV